MIYNDENYVADYKEKIKIDIDGIEYEDTLENIFKKVIKGLNKISNIIKTNDIEDISLEEKIKMKICDIMFSKYETFFSVDEINIELTDVIILFSFIRKLEKNENGENKKNIISDIVRHCFEISRR